MYFDSKFQWSVFVGCRFECVYCKPSFQRQMKRQKQNCEQCYQYNPHFHAERLTQRLPKTEGDEFVWIASSSDVSFLLPRELIQIFDRIHELPQIQFFMQTKDSFFFSNEIQSGDYDVPGNIWFGITLETNRDENYWRVSQAPLPSERYEDAKQTYIDIVTIEPVLDFDLDEFALWIEELAPKRVYIGYDTKNCSLNEPDLEKVQRLIVKMKRFTVVKPKLLREKWNSPKGRKLDQFFGKKENSE